MKIGSSNAGRWKRRFLASGFTAVMVVVAAFVFAPTVLCVDTVSTGADVIVVLGGDSRYRPQRAAELFNDDIAPRVIVSGDGDCESTRRTLRSHGVPEKAILMECESGSTRENAQFSIQMMRQLGLRKAVVVTSWFHSRRALKTFQATAPDLQFFSQPTYYGRDRTAWRSTGIRVHICHEYIKLLGYWLRWGVRPF